MPGETNGVEMVTTAKRYVYEPLRDSVMEESGNESPECEGEEETLLRPATFGRRVINEIGTLAGISNKQVVLSNLHPYSIAFRRKNAIIMWITLAVAATVCYGLYAVNARMFQRMGATKQSPLEYMVHIIAVPYQEDAMANYLGCFLHMVALGTVLTLLLLISRQRAVARFTLTVTSSLVVVWLTVALWSFRSPYSVFGQRDCQQENTDAQTALNQANSRRHARGSRSAPAQLCVSVSGAKDIAWTTGSLYYALSKIDSIEMHVDRAEKPVLPGVPTFELSTAHRVVERKASGTTADIEHLGLCANSVAPLTLAVLGDVKPPVSLGRWIRDKTNAADFRSITWTYPEFDFWRNAARVTYFWRAMAFLVAFFCVGQIYLRTRLTRYAFYYACIVACLVACVLVILLSSVTPEDCVSRRDGACDVGVPIPLATLYAMKDGRVAPCDALKNCDIVYTNALSWTRGACATFDKIRGRVI